jgi:predicted SAM-dependent methyltransferase
MRNVNIGCGPYKEPDYINIDINPRWGPDVVRDIRKGLPFDDSSVDMLLASHFLEHLSIEEFMEVMEECYRVLKPTGSFRIIVPLMDFNTLDHKLFFTESSFEIFFRETDGAEVYFNRKFKWTRQLPSRVWKNTSGYDCMELQIGPVK